jgi:hypothetical protein
MKQTLIISRRVPGLNDIINASTRVARNFNDHGGRHSSYSKTKADWKEYVVELCLEQRIRPVRFGVFVFTWIEPNKGRDPDNISAGGRKLILDGLVAAGVIANDGWKQVRGLQDRAFIVDTARVGAIVEIISI